MGRHTDRDNRKNKGAAARTKPERRGKPKVCVFCVSHAVWVDYKDTNVLRRLMSDRGKIKARRVTGTCRQHQRDLAVAIKTAREMALLPYLLLPAASDKGGPRNTRAAPRGMGPPPGNAEMVWIAGAAAGEPPDGVNTADHDEPVDALRVTTGLEGVD